MMVTTSAASPSGPSPGRSSRTHQRGCGSALPLRFWEQEVMMVFMVAGAPHQALDRQVEEVFGNPRARLIVYPAALTS